MINSESTDNIIADGFTMNQESPSTLNTKLLPYHNYNKIVPNKNHASQQSCKANSEIIGDKSNKELFINPYTKMENNRMGLNSMSKPNSFYQKAPYSSNTSDHNSKIGSEKKVTMGVTKPKTLSMNPSKHRRNGSSKSKSKNRNREMNASIESVEDFDSNPVYIDTGGSNMQ